jgi:hypothetical protein
LTLVQTVPLTGAVIVATPQAVALADVRKAVGMFKQTGIHVLGVVENMSGSVFGEGGGRAFAEQNGYRFLGTLPLVAQVRELGDAGRPPVLSDDPTVSGPFRASPGRSRSAAAIRCAGGPASRSDFALGLTHERPWRSSESGPISSKSIGSTRRWRGWRRPASSPFHRRRSRLLPGAAAPRGTLRGTLRRQGSGDEGDGSRFRPRHRIPRNRCFAQHERRALRRAFGEDGGNGGRTRHPRRFTFR